MKHDEKQKCEAMTDEKEMTIDEALKLAVTALEDVASTWPGSAVEFFQAAAVLRQIGEPVERSEVDELLWCTECNKPYSYTRNSCKCGHRLNCIQLPVTKRWTETPVLKLVIENSEPVYEPVNTQAEGKKALRQSKEYEQLRAHAESAEKELAELKAENERLKADNLAMRRCENCRNYRYEFGVSADGECNLGDNCFNACLNNDYQHWEAVKND